MDIHLTWLDRIYSVLSSWPFNPGRTPPPTCAWLFKESDWAYWVVGNQKAGRKNVKQHHRSTGQVRININDIWFPPHNCQICLEMFSGTGIGPMVNRARSASTARGKTYIHETKVMGWPSASLWLYEVSLLRTSAIVMCSYTHLPHARVERNAWKHHYCALIRTTVNGWVKVPLKMHDDLKTKNKKEKKNAHMKRAHGLYRLVWVDILTAESNIIM